jgi:hypothetical protein
VHEREVVEGPLDSLPESRPGVSCKEGGCHACKCDNWFAEPFSRLLALLYVKEGWQEVHLIASQRAGLALAAKKGVATPMNMIIGHIANIAIA